jgi:outer membrane protein OmpA-like peptidoglycan-associated protein
VRRDEGQQSEEQPELSEREQRLRERRARQQAEQEEREKRARDRKQAQTDERQERLRRLEEERQRELKAAEERRENRDERRKRELADQERDRSERAKRITGQQEDESRERRARRLEAIEGGEISQEERNERRRVRREFTDETLGDVKRARRQSREGNRVIIEEPDNRRIIREGRRVIIEEDDKDRLRGASRDVKTERGPRGRERDVITRRNGVQIITVRNREGDVVRRIKKLKNGREIVLFNNEPRRKRARRDDGGFSFFIDLPDFRIERSRRDYYIYADRADEDEIEAFLSAEPIEEFEEEYTLDEIRYSPDIRARFSKLNVNTVNFEFGSWDIPEDQFDKLEVVARVINRIIERDESEMFLLAGHTDLVGSVEDNLSLSSRRTETVARILTDEFGVPPENLVTQGYGESDPLIDTEKPEAANRRVEFMRITPALAQYDE